MACATENVPTKQQLADGLGISRQALRGWQANDNAPIEEALALPVNEGVALLRKWRANNKRPAPGINSKPESLRERLLLAQCERTEQQARSEQLANDQVEGRLVDRESAEFDLAAALSILRCRFEELSEYVANEFGGDVRYKVRDLVEGRVHLFLQELSRTKIETLSESLGDTIIAASERILTKRANSNGQNVDEAGGVGECHGALGTDREHADELGGQHESGAADG